VVLEKTVVLGLCSFTLASVLACEPPGPTTQERRAFCLAHQVALWDVIHACDIQGAADASIRNPEPNRFAPLIARTRIQAVFTTGRAAASLFERLCAAEAGMHATYLPSTSPANRAQQARPEFRRLWEQVARQLG
jgi:hypoxanthine-DNA glycosylase